MSIYAIGDIHGHLEKLKDVLDLITADQAKHGLQNASVVFLGDLTDRGPDSRGVMDFVIDGIAAGKPWIVIKGNHDRMFQFYLDDPSRADPKLRVEMTWMNPRLGGDTTLASYGVKVGEDGPEQQAAARAAVPQSHVEFLQNLPFFHEHEGVFFVHAGVQPGIALADQVEDDLLWIRKEFHDSDLDHGALIVHGHTPVEAATHYGNRVNLDTGAGYGKAISVAVFEGRDVALLTDTGRVTLDPSA